MSKYLFGNTWYYFLNRKGVESLVNARGEDSINHGLVISYQTKRSRLYTLYRDINRFEEVLSQVRETQQHFYEVICSRGQKPHFDIDIEVDPNADPSKDSTLSPERLIDDLINRIGKVMKEKGVEIEDENILVYNSSGMKENGKRKESYHVIIDGYYHSDNIQAYHFYLRVIKDMKFKYQKVIDGSVYKKVQQFRLLGSRKEGSDRVKKYTPWFNYTPKDPFRSSLISYLGGCQLLPPFKIKKPLSEDKEEEDYFQDRETESDALQILQKRFPDHIPFKYDPETSRKTQGLIILQRVDPSFCQVCKRIHENENPYMFIAGDNLYLNCRRNTESLLLKRGFLSPEKIDFDQNLKEIGLLSKPEKRNLVPKTVREKKRTPTIEGEKKRSERVTDERLRSERANEKNVPKNNNRTSLETKGLRKIPPVRKSSEETLELDQLIDLSGEKLPRYKRPEIGFPEPERISSNHRVSDYLFRK